MPFCTSNLAFAFLIPKSGGESSRKFMGSLFKVAMAKFLFIEVNFLLLTQRKEKRSLRGEFINYPREYILVLPENISLVTATPCKN